MRRRKKGWMNLKVVKILEDSHDTKTLFLEDADEGGVCFDYIAGQYLTFRFDDISERPVVRSYTMSSSPCEASAIAITVKREPEGLVSKLLTSRVEVGDTLRARGPIGKFTYDPNKDKKNLVMIAGGIGVTPFISIIREFCYSPDSFPETRGMSLFVSYKTSKDILFESLLKEACSRKGVRIVRTLTRERPTSSSDYLHGRIDQGLVESHIANFSDATFMTCGPERMIEGTMDFLSKKGVEPAHNRTESFD